MNPVQTKPGRPSLNRAAFSATVHCLSGCAVGEVSGMMIGNSLGWGNAFTIGLSVVLAFLFGYAFTLLPILRSQIDFHSALKLVFASDTISILIMEIVDNGVMLVIPGAMDAKLSEPLFWASMTVSLLLAGAAAFPVNRWLIARNQGHAVIHRFHDHGENHASSDDRINLNPTGRGHHMHHA